MLVDWDGTKCNQGRPVPGGLPYILCTRGKRDILDLYHENNEPSG